MSTTAHTTLAYVGPDVDDGSMDVSDLAPALLAASRLITAANRQVNGERADARVRVAALRSGSFEIDLQVVTSLWAQTKSLVLGADVQTAKNLLEILGLAATGVAGTTVTVVQLIKWLKGRALRRIVRSGEMVVIFVESEAGEETIEVSEPVARLAMDSAVRRELASLASPVSRPGINALEVRSGETVLERIEEADLPSLAEPSVRESPLVADVREQSFEIVSLAFRDENKWRLSDGNVTISVAIEDKRFLSAVNESRISFSKGDVLRCRVRFEQVQTATGLRTTYAVEEVLQHFPAVKTLPLPFPGTAA